MSPAGFTVVYFKQGDKTGADNRKPRLRMSNDTGKLLREALGSGSELICNRETAVVRVDEFRVQPLDSMRRSVALASWLLSVLYWTAKPAPYLATNSMYPRQSIL